MRQIVVSNAHLEVEEDRSLGVVIARRKATRPEARELHDAFEAALDRYRSDPRKLGLVVDMRLAPGRNDAGFEATSTDLRQAAGRHFARVVVLVASASGELQIRRLARQDGRLAMVTRDPEEALALASGAELRVAPTRA